LTKQPSTINLTPLFVNITTQLSFKDPPPADHEEVPGNQFISRKSKPSPTKTVERVRNPPTKRVLALQEKKIALVPKIEEPDDEYEVQHLQQHEVILELRLVQTNPKRN
jgi:hypothetical protein